MKTATRERMIGIMAGPDLAVIMLFSWLEKLTRVQLQTRATDVALHLLHYNFARIHKTLRITPLLHKPFS